MVITLSFSLSKEGVSRVYFVKVWKWNQENFVLLDYMGKVNFGQYNSERGSLRPNFRIACLRPCANKSWPLSIRSTMSSLVKIYEHPNQVFIYDPIWPWPLSLWPWGQRSRPYWKILLPQYLTSWLRDLIQTWHANSLWRVHELIRYSRSLY